MTQPDAADRFEGTAAYYAEHRPGYGDAAIRHLVERFDLDGSDRVLDLGCGAGQVAVPLAEHAGVVVGMDPNEAMLREARERAAAAGLENLEWVVGSDAALERLAGPFRLATMGRSFHWMDGERTLDRLYRLAEPGGGVALLGDPEWLTKGRADWQAAVHAVADDYVADLPERVDPADVEYEKTWEQLLRESAFADVAVETFDVERTWDVDAVVGYVFSLSFCSPPVLGDAAGQFERDLRARLDELGGGPFDQDATVEVISARR